MPKQFYSASEAAKMLGISFDTLRRWDRDGRIETARDAGNRRIVAAAEISRLRGEEGTQLSARNRLNGTVSAVKVVPARLTPRFLWWFRPGRHAGPPARHRRFLVRRAPELDRSRERLHLRR